MHFLAYRESQQTSPLLSRLLCTRDHPDPEHIVISIAVAVSTKSRFLHCFTYRLELQYISCDNHSMGDLELHIALFDTTCYG